MAAKKKKKDHKKPKKVIEVTFETSRLTSGLDFRKAQIELYEKASIEEIEDAMNYHGILLHADQVVSDYKPVVSVDTLEEKIEGVKNYSIAVKEKGEDIIFLRKIVEGGTDESYGVHVAKLAGVPKDVTKRANEILKSPERKKAVSSVELLKHCIELFIKQVFPKL